MRNRKTPIVKFVFASFLLGLVACSSTETIENNATVNTVTVSVDNENIDKPKEAAQIVESNIAEPSTPKPEPVLSSTSEEASLKPHAAPVKADKIVVEPAKPVSVKPKKVEKRSKPITTVVVAKKQASLSGNVKLLGSNSKLLSPQGMIVLLEPNNKIGHKAKPASAAMIEMINKQYLPAVSTISKQQQMKFKNKDQVKHNVFSSSSVNSFDLGTYGKGKVSDVSFEEKGIVKVYCNIHPDMVAFIGVSEFNYSAIVDEDGNFKIKALPLGGYSIKIWSPRGELNESIYFSNEAIMNKRFILNASNHQVKAHKNKYGKDYDGASLFDDEFY